VKSLKIRVRAPSNIALIKYMGKQERNIPENASLSMTLNKLCTFLEIEVIDDGANGFKLDAETPELPSGFRKFPTVFKPEAVSKFENHYRRVQSRMTELAPARSIRADRASVRVKSVNTFPAGSGIASSASSFAALTLGSYLANLQNLHAEIPEIDAGLRRRLARISREGSGSSCRSFEGPWVEWQGENASQCGSNLPEMAHFVIVVEAREKKVSSSEAHIRVKTSPLWAGRVSRVTDRFERLRGALESGDRVNVSKFAWVEMWEMHSLFHTAAEPFSYWNPQTIDALHFFSEFVRSENSTPPIVTLDAGPNVHVIVPLSEKPQWRERLIAKFGADALLEDSQGHGAEILDISHS
jgi:diphosphomevalonate decarboxylase